MGFVIPFINRDVADLKAVLRDKLKEEKNQKRLVLVIVCVALLLDNMLYMVIVPIIPDYLRRIGAYEEACENGKKRFRYLNGSYNCEVDYKHEDERLGFLFASKAILQLLVNPFSGTLIDRIGYEIPMIIGLIVMFVSTSLFALGRSYGLLFFARLIQGFGSAFADTAGLAMIADRFSEESERSKALGVAIAFISFGSLVAPPFGGFLYEFAGISVPFLFLAMICLADAFMVFMVIQPKVRKMETGERLKGTPIWRLFLDPYIAICAGGLVMANVSLAFLEPTIGKWMEEWPKPAKEWQIGFIWLPAFLPHLGGVFATLYLMKRMPQQPWLIAAAGLAIEGVSCFIVPFCKSYGALIFPISLLCFGIALIDTSILPLLGYLVDTRHVSVYGSVYAIADISYSLAYAIGPIIAGSIVSNLNFFALNLGICLSNLIYAPALAMLRTVYQYKPFESTQLSEYEASDRSLEDGAVLGVDYKNYGSYGGTYNPQDEWSGVPAPQISEASPFNQARQPGVPTPKQNVEYKDTLYNRKVKKKGPGSGYRGYKDTDAILGDDEYDDVEPPQDGPHQGFPGSNPFQ